LPTDLSIHPSLSRAVGAFNEGAMTIGDVQTKFANIVISNEMFLPQKMRNFTREKAQQ
jgi:hypothetical protein